MTRESVQGSSVNKKDVFVTIRDHTTKHILVRMKNPKVPIGNLNSKFELDLDN